MRLLFILQIVAELTIPQQQVTWQIGAMSPTQAQGYTYTLYIQQESGVKSWVVLLNVLCGTGSSGLYECSAVLPPAGNPAIISNNVSTLSAKDPVTQIESNISAPFTGNQGCIWMDNLYPIDKEATQQTNKQNIQNTINQFKAAKFEFVRTTPLPKGNQFLVTAKCVGHL